MRPTRMPNRRNEARDAALAAGQSTFMPTRSCRNGHLAPRYVGTYKCKQCDADKHAKRRQREDFKTAASRRHRAWRDRDPAEVRRKSQDWYKRNTERHRSTSADWKKRNPDATNAIRRRYYANSPKPLAYVKARAKRVRQATPKWADIGAIRRFYEMCPENMQVDHIVPLRGESVCGLHVVENLQYLTPRENADKGNRWPVESTSGSVDLHPFQYEPFHVMSATTPKE